MPCNPEEARLHARDRLVSLNRDSSADPAGRPLATIPIRDERDAVRVCRWVRGAAVPFGLDGHTVRGFSAAALEVGRVAGGEAIAEAWIEDGPRMRLSFRAPTSHGRRQRFAELEDSLRTVVRDVAVSERGDTVALTLAAPAAPSAEAPTQMTLRDCDSAEGAEGSTPGDEIGTLRQTCRELLAELQESTRTVIALCADVEKLTEQTRTKEDQLNLVLDSVQDGAVCTLTAEGTIATWNTGAERMFVHRANEIIGRAFGALFPSSEHATSRSLLQTLDGTSHLETDVTLIRRSGDTFDAHLHLTSVSHPDRGIRGFTVVVRNISERKRLENDLRGRAEDLAAANRAKEDFLATISHELRTPLNAMLGWTRLLRSGRLDRAKMARALETIERNAQIQAQLIADILDVSRIVTGKLRVNLRPVDVSPIVEAALDTLRPSAEAKGLRIEADLDSVPPVMGDSDRLQQVVWNLVANAVKFTPPGGRVTVELKHEGSNAMLAVIDTGEGIPGNVLPFIFDRFRQGDASATRPHGGLGLGLSIVRHIVELHGGTVSVASEGPGRGATFSVLLPLCREADAVKS